MNTKVIRYVFGKVLLIEGALLLLPILTALIYHEKEGFMYLYVALGAAFIGLLFSLKKPDDYVFFFK
ncbi:MAG: TrkH family potassium uptake protein, partial [Lachnospiraceae bacterium]|nr:TrkH family potassium uptake protein [Lachnospiraceae bacterium]